MLLKNRSQELHNATQVLVIVVYLTKTYLENTQEGTSECVLYSSDKFNTMQ